MIFIPLPQLKPENNDDYENRVTLRLYIEKLLNQKVGRQYSINIQFYRYIFEILQVELAFHLCLPKNPQAEVKFQICFCNFDYLALIINFQFNIIVYNIRIYDIFCAVSGIASLATVGIYIVSTYFDQVEWLGTLDIVVCSLYLTEYSLKLFAAQHRLQYIFSDFAIIELLTVFPLLTIQSVGSWNYLQRLINISRILRVFRVVRMINKFQSLSDTEYGGVTRQIYVIFSTVTTIIIVTAGVLYAFELPKRQELIGKDPNRGCSNQIDRCNFHEMIYSTRSVIYMNNMSIIQINNYSKQWG